MFERYTEGARRTLFFARHEASQLGSVNIEPEHLLLGLIREDGALSSVFARVNITPDDLLADVAARHTHRSVDGALPAAWAVSE